MTVRGRAHSTMFRPRALSQFRIRMLDLVYHVAAKNVFPSMKHWVSTSQYVT